MKKNILVLSTIFAISACGGASGNIQISLTGDEYGPRINTAASEKGSSTYYNFISAVFALVDHSVSLTVTPADFTAKKGSETLNAISFIDSYGLTSGTNGSSYYIISTSTSKDIEVKDGEQPGSLFVSFDISVNSSFTFYYKNIQLIPGQYVAI